MSGCAVRAAGESDLPRLTELFAELAAYHAALDSRYSDGAGREREIEAQLRAWTESPRAALLVAEMDGAIVGFGSGVLQEPNPAMAPVRGGRIIELAVTAASRRQGIGEALTQALLDWFRAQGVGRVFVGAAIRNPVSSAFWKKMGFTDFVLTRSLDLPDGPGSLRDTVL
jgi:GNAT superfamily N-acetyltransferase